MRARVWASTPPPEKSTIPQIPHIRRLPPWGLGSREATWTSERHRLSARTAVRGVSEGTAPRPPRVAKVETRHAIPVCPNRRADVQDPLLFVYAPSQSEHPWKG